MAILSNINDKFRVDSAGAVYFGTSAGTNLQVLQSIGTSGSPTWVNVDDIIGGPYLPLTGGTLNGNLAISGSNSLSVGGTLTGTTATFSTVQISNGNSYNENIRMFAASNDYSSLVLGAVSGTSGSGIGQWTLVRYPSATHSNKFSIRHNSVDAIVITKEGKVGVSITPSDWNTTALQSGQGSISQDVNSVYVGANTYNSSAGWKRINAQLAGYMRMGTNDGIWSFSNAVTGTANSIISWNERMRIDTSGNVMMGKTSQSGNAALTVKSTAGGNTGIILVEGDTVNDGWGVYATTANEYRITRFTNGSYSDKFIITSGGNATFTGDVEIAANLFSTGQNLKFHAAGTHVMNIDINGKVYPNINNAYDLGHSASLAWRNLYLSGSATIPTIASNTNFTGDIYQYGSIFRNSSFIDVVGNRNSKIELETAYFTNTVSNLAVNIQFPNVAMQGYYKITLSGSYSNQDISGKLTKVIPFGYNPNGSIWRTGNSQSEITIATGGVSTNFTIGNLAWDSTNSKFIVPVYKLTSSGNSLRILIEYFGAAANNLKDVNLSSNYTQTAPSPFNVRQYQNIRDRLGIGTASPQTKLEVNGGLVKIDESGNTAFYGGDYVRVFGTQSYSFRNTGGSAIANISMNGNSYFNGGNVGIGTTSPSTPLMVNRALNSTLPTLYLDTQGGSGGSVGLGQNTTIGPYLIGNTLPNGDVRGAYPASRMLFNGGGFSFQTSDETSGARTFDDKMKILINGNVGIGTTSPFSKLQVGNKMFDGTNGMYNNGRVGISNHGILTGMMLASTYNDAAHPEYGLVFVQGPSTSSYNVWSISPDGPAKGSSLIFNYQAQSTNIHSPANAKVCFQGSSGNVGIGTTSPAQKLTVNGNIGFTGLLGQGSIYGNTGNSSYAEMQLYNPASGYTIIDNKAYGYYFATAGSTKLTILNNGNVGIGNTSPQTTLHVGTTTTVTNQFTNQVNASNFLVNGNANGGASFFQCKTAAVNINMMGNNDFACNQFTFYHKPLSTSQNVVGTIATFSSSTQYNTTSDYRLKENVIPLSDSITRLKQLKPSRFNFIEDPERIMDGFLAHEVQDIVPEAVNGEKDAVDENGNEVHQGIDQAKLVPLLVAAIQELEARVKELENK